MIRRPPRSTLDRSSAASDVYKRQPQQVTLEGSRRWAKLAQVSEDERRTKFPSLEELMPDIYKQLLAAESSLEKHLSLIHISEPTRPY